MLINNTNPSCRLKTIIFVLLIAFAGSIKAQEYDANNPSILTLERIFTDEEFETADFGPARWVKDGSGYTTLEENESFEEARDIVKYNPVNGERQVIVSAERLIPQGKDKPIAIDDYQWSKAGKKLLIFTNTRRVWRRNTRGDYWVLDLISDKLSKLGGNAEESGLMFAKFSPDGEKVAYVYKNNLYIQSLGTMKIRQLTHDGSDTIINGTGDWVNEEEFDLRDGFEFSPDGRFIAFHQFDTNGVNHFKLINYTDSLYPEIVSFPYPKVGQINSASRVGVVSTKGGKRRIFENPGDPRNTYIPRIQWTQDSKNVVIQHLNRRQNTNKIMLGPVRMDWLGNTQIRAFGTVFEDIDDAWVDVHGKIDWINEGKGFLLLSERDGWRHIWYVSIDGSELILLTAGEYDVLGIEKVDEKRGWVYFIASPDNPTQRYLYRVTLDGKKLERISPEDMAGIHSYQISEDCLWAIHTHSSFENPPVIELVSLPDHRTVQTLQDNSELKEKVSILQKTDAEFFRIEIGDNIELDGWCIKPPDFDPGKKYPLLLHVYGEPAGQTVLDRWGGNNHLWHLMLAQNGYIVASIDNRGTPAPRGREWRKCVYKQIGVLASADQAAATKAFIENRSYIDPNRVGIWGWSGGGSMTLNAMFRYPDIYKTGISIAFIADERFYDTIYQERYMGLLEDNEESYIQGSPITFASKLEGNLLLVYGTGDDNCHFQNCQVLINELVKNGKQFSMISYPNRTHSIKEGDGTRRHLYESMTKYLRENLLLK